MCWGRSATPGRSGAATVGITCNRPSVLGGLVDLEIAPLVGPEVLAGSTRLKAGTATKMILNMITTGAMIRIGKTLGNRMIDLKPSNEKLRIRSRRMLRELAGVDDAAAGRLLEKSGGRLKLALVMALAQVDAAAAEAALAAGDGQVHAAVRAAAAGRGEEAMSGTGSCPARRRRRGDVDGGLAGRRRRPGARRRPCGAVERQGGRARGRPRALGHAIARAFADAGIAPAAVAAACLGLAGFDRPDDRRLLTGWAEAGAVGRPARAGQRRRPRAGCRHAEGWGLAVIAGTGSIAVGRTPAGRTARAGGWGPLIGDEGSAYAVALAALRLAGPPRATAASQGGATRAPARSLTHHLCAGVGFPARRRS